MKRVALALAAAALLAGAPALADDAGAPKPTPPTRPTPPTKPTVPGKGGPAGKPTTQPPAKPTTQPAKPAPAKPAPAPKPAPAKPAKPEAAKPEAAGTEPKRPDEDSFDDDDGKPAATAASTEAAPSGAPASAAVAAPVKPLDVHAAPPPDQSYSYRHPVLLPTITWLAFQLLPSPEIVVSRQRTIAADGSSHGSADATWGVRWQLTPLLWSWGVHRKQSPWRMVEVDPLARVAGSIEVWTAVEYIGGNISRPFVRPGVRGFFPLIDRGEYLSTSIGTSIYRFDNALRVAYDVGFYVLSGIFGINVTFAPTHAPMTSIITFNMRYF